MRRLLATAILLFVISGRPAPAGQGGAPDPELAAGIAAVTAKDYKSAIGTLSQVVRRLGPDPVRQEDLVTAYLNLGVAFAGLGQESPARSQFAQALLRKPDVRLDVKDAPELAKKLFAEAQREAAPVIAVAAQQQKKSSRLPLILVGVAAVGAGAAVVVNAGGTPSVSMPPPTFGNLEPARSFQFAFINGTPFLSLVSGEPGSGSTLSAASARPRFVFRVTSATVSYPRAQATVGLETVERGTCWSGESAPFALPAASSVEVVVDAFPAMPACAPPFTSLSLSARFLDLAAGRQVSVTGYTGGYKVVP